ncbi:type IV secretion system protein [Aliivibrio fischeri]|uniref:type IV secretion system protein n=1 Tax=Aliivibrio fischeri TaxID=668 RepID=UPI00084C50B4|nr:type IV secretion system protein [Aliivibrio fischeri]OED53641.1 hypothetical protein BEI47_17455 [Aliivibrio fischeri]
MSASNTFRDVFSHSIVRFVDTLITSGEVAHFALSLTIVLVVILYFSEVAKFMLKGIDIDSITHSTLMVFATLLIIASYQTLFDNANAFFDEIGLSIQESATGARDPFFLFNWVTHAFNSMYGEDVSFFMMPVGDVIYAGLWYLVALVLQIMMFAISSWAVWSLALAKILGILFVPLLIHPTTRSVFDGWFKFTLGSFMLLIVLRATGALSALAIQAQFQSIGLMMCGDALNFATCSGTDRVTNTSMMSTDAADLIVTGIMAILLIGSSMGLTATLIGGLASPSKAMTRGTMKGANVLGKLLSK